MSKNLRKVRKPLLGLQSGAADPIPGFLERSLSMMSKIQVMMKRQLNDVDTYVDIESVQHLSEPVPNFNCRYTSANGVHELQLR